MAKALVITEADDKGNVMVKVQGVAGSTCEKLTEGLEAALGVVKERYHTDEFKMTAEEQQENVQRPQN